MSPKYVQVAVNAPLHQTLTYSCDREILRGQPVTVPLGRRQTTGVVVGETTTAIPDSSKIKSIGANHEEWPVIHDKFLNWLEWLAKYYQYPLGQVINTVFPPLKKNTTRKSKQPPLFDDSVKTPKHELTAEQKICFEKIKSHKGFSPHLLFGVTGSGKTEVYLEVLEEVLAQGKQGLFLVPEISLTPQLVQRFANRFGNSVAVIHSHLTEREKTTQWWEMVDKKKQILVGARSALFCPLENLGCIIIDEEHETSFKQDEKLKYHARDAGIMLAKLHDCPIILGSATPSMESWNNAKMGRYQLHVMKSRVENRSLPTIEIIDLKKLKEQRAETNLPFWLSPTLYQKLKENLYSRHQSALFLNRRGTAQAVLCPACGFSHECPNCSLSLTLHGKKHLLCHYCDYHENLSERCPHCKIGEIRSVGLGTEKIEADIQLLFPEARLARADRDEIQSRGDLEDFIHKIENHEVDIIIGTQMIAKGLDFKKLTLVGLVLADIGFNMPDFRSSERSFQLVLQVSGRAGRHVKPGDDPGQVVIQTFNPDHMALTYAQKNDYEGFAAEELRFRESLGYPPFGRLAAFRIRGNDQINTRKNAQTLLAKATQLKNKYEDFKNLEILGPTEAPLSKLKGQYRYHLLIKGSKTNALNVFCQHLHQQDLAKGQNVKIQLDIDPLNLL